jgi:L-fucono-1,5-lactonase
MAAGLGLTMLAETRHYRHVLHALDVLPTSPVTLNHLGMRFADVDRGQWLAAMRRFGRHSHVTLQLSGLPFLFGTQWRDPEATQVMDDALDIFGPQRLMFASDWPMMLRFATYGDWVQSVADFLIARGLSDAEQAAIFGGNVIRANPRLAAAAPHLIRRTGAGLPAR